MQIYFRDLCFPLDDIMRLELMLPDSKSGVLTTTLYVIVMRTGIEPVWSGLKVL